MGQGSSLLSKEVIGYIDDISVLVHILHGIGRDVDSSDRLSEFIEKNKEDKIYKSFVRFDKNKTQGMSKGYMRDMIFLLIINLMVKLYISSMIDLSSKTINDSKELSASVNASPTAGDVGLSFSESVQKNIIFSSDIVKEIVDRIVKMLIPSTIFSDRMGNYQIRSLVEDFLMTITIDSNNKDIVQELKYSILKGPVDEGEREYFRMLYVRISKLTCFSSDKRQEVVLWRNNEYFIRH